ncbi:MAG: squalene--hopene cyclase [Verrucomicrobia bacterium]|nr:squalene--hopene cyclase [Verrucomicrobiota bacterium]MBV8485731.1 squalene--hopene cyclase [Verrucomicrobiota bacterium]
MDLEDGIERAQSALFSLQRPEGYWLGELEGNSTLYSDYMAFMHWSGDVHPERQKKCVEHLLENQLENGGWSIYRGGPARLDPSVKAYLALKLAGFESSAPRLRRAADLIRKFGGIANSRYYTRFYLALLGQVAWSNVPSIPVELVLLPKWSPINLYSMSAWTRAIVVPMAIAHHFQPTRPIRFARGVSELYVSRPRNNHTWKDNWFEGALILLERLQRGGFLSSHESALMASERWMLDRLNLDGNGLGAIFPSILHALIALRCLGYDHTTSVYQKAEKALEGLFVNDAKGFRIQPCLSPVWDTALSTIALVESGVAPDDSRIQKAANWLTSHRVTTKGDWAVRIPNIEPSGWSFEFKNSYYPDVDDTAMVLLALSSAVGPREHLMQKSLDWLLSFQCRDGGWAAFDKDVQNPLLKYLPFADHRAILDPSCPDITGRILEALANFRIGIAHPSVRKAVRFLRAKQEDDGSWYGRWGVNYIYGTAHVLRGVRSTGIDMNQKWLAKARRWVEAHQNSDGGWGESCASYLDVTEKGRGESTASQTAWSLMGLCAFPDVNRKSIARGIEFLLHRQRPDGTWDEDLQTGTGFPSVLYLRYDYYRIYWPLRALSIYAANVKRREENTRASIDSGPVVGVWS